VLLRKGHLRAEELMEFLEVGGIFLSAGRTEAQVGVDCDVGVVAFVGKEGRDTCGCTRGVVKCELRKWEEFGPIVLLVVTVDSEVLFESLVHLLSLTISFWVITRGEMQGHSKCFSERVEEMGDELRTSVGGDMGGYSVFGKHVCDKELGKLRGSDGVVGRNEYSLLQEVVHDD